MSLAVENENPDIEELNEIDSLQSDNEEEANEFSDSDDEFVPPPPPEEGGSLPPGAPPGMRCCPALGGCR